MPPSAWWAAPAMGASRVSLAFSLPSEMVCFYTLAALYGQTPSGVKRHHRPVGRRKGRHGRWSGARVKGKKAEGFRAYDRSSRIKKGTNEPQRNGMLTREARRSGFYGKRRYACFHRQFSP